MKWDLFGQVGHGFLHSQFILLSQLTGPGLTPPGYFNTPSLYHRLHYLKYGAGSLICGGVEASGCVGSVNFCLFTLFSSSGRLGHGGVFLIGGVGFTEINTTYMTWFIQASSCKIQGLFKDFLKTFLLFQSFND